MVIACHNMFILYSMWFITSIVMFIHNTHILIIFTIFENLKKDLFVKSSMQNTMHHPGIEPRPPAWQVSILPLNQRCSLADPCKHNWVITMMGISWDWKKDSRSVGFEPTPAERNWFLVSRLNHSATTAHCLWVIASSNPTLPLESEQYIAWVLSSV